MRQISCDGCGKTAEYASGHDIRRSSFHDGETELSGDLCSQCRAPIIAAFPSGRVELTIPDFVLPLSEHVVVWDGVDRADTVIL